MFKPWLKPEVETPARTFTPDLDGLIAWLETQDGATEYDHADWTDCLVCRFASEVLGRRVRFTEADTLIGGSFPAGSCTSTITLYKPWIYAAALTRAINLRDAGK